MKIIDDLLDPYEYDLLEKLFSGHEFPWFWSDQVLYDKYDNCPDYRCGKLDNYQLFHWFYKDGAPRSEHFDNIVPILNKLQIGSLIKIKANLNTYTPEVIEHGYHYDQDWKNTKTCVYYLNDNDGYTLFQDGNRVDSKANRAVVFDGKTSHSGTTCSNQKRRIVININYYPIER